MSSFYCNVGLNGVKDSFGIETPGEILPKRVIFPSFPSSRLHTPTSSRISFIDPPHSVFRPAPSPSLRTPAIAALSSPIVAGAGAGASSPRVLAPEAIKVAATALAVSPVMLVASVSPMPSSSSSSEPGRKEAAAAAPMARGAGLAASAAAGAGLVPPTFSSSFSSGSTGVDHCERMINQTLTPAMLAQLLGPQLPRNTRDPAIQSAHTATFHTSHEFDKLEERLSIWQQRILMFLHVKNYKEIYKLLEAFSPQTARMNRTDANRVAHLSWLAKVSTPAGSSIAEVNSSISKIDVFLEQLKLTILYCHKLSLYSRSSCPEFDRPFLGPRLANLLQELRSEYESSPRKPVRRREVTEDLIKTIKSYLPVRVQREDDSAYSTLTVLGKINLADDSDSNLIRFGLIINGHCQEAARKSNPAQLINKSGELLTPEALSVFCPHIKHGTAALVLHETAPMILDKTVGAAPRGIGQSLCQVIATQMGFLGRSEVSWLIIQSRPGASKLIEFTVLKYDDQKLENFVRVSFERVIIDNTFLFMHLKCLPKTEVFEFTNCLIDVFQGRAPYGRGATERSSIGTIRQSLEESFDRAGPPITFIFTNCYYTTGIALSRTNLETDLLAGYPFTIIINNIVVLENGVKTAVLENGPESCVSRFQQLNF